MRGAPGRGRGRGRGPALPFKLAKELGVPQPGRGRGRGRHSAGRSQPTAGSRGAAVRNRPPLHAAKPCIRAALQATQQTCEQRGGAVSVRRLASRCRCAPRRSRHAVRAGLPGRGRRALRRLPSPHAVRRARGPALAATCGARRAGRRAGSAGAPAAARPRAGSGPGRRRRRRRAPGLRSCWRRTCCGCGRRPARAAAGTAAQPRAGALQSEASARRRACLSAVLPAAGR